MATIKLYRDLITNVVAALIVLFSCATAMAQDNVSPAVEGENGMWCYGSAIPACLELLRENEAVRVPEPQTVVVVTPSTPEPAPMSEEERVRLILPTRVGGYGYGGLSIVAGQVGIGASIPIAERFSLEVAILPAGVGTVIVDEETSVFLTTGWQVRGLIHASDRIGVGLGYFGQALVGQETVPANAHFGELSLQIGLNDHWSLNLNGNAGFGSAIRRDEYGTAHITDGFGGGGSFGITFAY